MLEALKCVAAGRTKEGERTIVQERRKKFKEKMTDRFPGSNGLVHRICRWRAAWQPPTASVSKQQMPLEPQLAADKELEEWSAVWRVGQGETHGLWTDELGSSLVIACKPRAIHGRGQ